MADCMSNSIDEILKNSIPEMSVGGEGVYLYYAIDLPYTLRTKMNFRPNWSKRILTILVFEPC